MDSRSSWLSLVAGGLLVAGCGGRASDARGTSSSTSGDSGSEREVLFDTLVTGSDRYCGITRGDRRVVCIEDDKIVVDEEGPFRSMDMNAEIGPAWDYRCAVKESGELTCSGMDGLEVPSGEFADVSIGVFNGCARRRSGELECWIPIDFGGVQPPSSGGQYYSVSMWSLCTQHDRLNAECFDSGGNQLLPTDGSGHFLGGLYSMVVAAPEAGCAAVLVAVEAEYEGTPLEPFADVLSKSNIACFSHEGARSKLDGTFTQFDVDVNEDGCALDGSNGVACWGRFANSVPADLTGDFVQVSVATGQACVLDVAGSVRCWQPR